MIAVDPTSPYTGGAILGDRIRMQRHHADPGVFIRSMATRGWLGGLASATTEMTMLLDAAGFDVVIVETVGVGQDEVEIARLADVTLVVMVPGMGDDVQAIKAGIIEIADVFVINKADLPGAEKLERELNSYLGLSHRPDGWSPKIVAPVASEGKGIAEVLDAAREYHARGARADRARRKSGACGCAKCCGSGCWTACRPRNSRRRDAKWRSTGAILIRFCMTGLSGFKIDHLGIAVRSLDRALEFYRDQLGLDVSLRETVAQEKVNVAMLPLGEPRIELLEPAEAGIGDREISRQARRRAASHRHSRAGSERVGGAPARVRRALLNEPRAGAGGHLMSSCTRPPPAACCSN